MAAAAPSNPKPETGMVVGIFGSLKKPVQLGIIFGTGAAPGICIYVDGAGAGTPGGLSPCEAGCQGGQAQGPG